MSRSDGVTTGLVLNVRDSKEADRFVTLLSPEFGRMRFNAKGVRRSGSKRAAALNPGTVVRCSWVGKGEWLTLTEVVPQQYLLGPGMTLETIRDFSVVLEMVYYLSLEGTEQEELYSQALVLLKTIGLRPDYNRGWIRQQLLEIAAAQGLAETSMIQGQSVTKILEEALERPLRSFGFLSVE